MKHKKKLLASIAINAVLLILSVLYTVLFNESRLAAPTDWAGNSFRAADLVLIVPAVLLALQIIVLLVLCLVEKKQENTLSRQYTRTISPKLGLMGFAGLMGLLGFLPLDRYEPYRSLPFPFLFFCFFGFFGFYYEGKMSHTLIDERYKMNAFRAAAEANQIGFALIVLVTIFSVSLFRVTQTDLMVSILFAAIGLAFGLSTFMGQYLLYRYDCEE